MEPPRYVPDDPNGIVLQEPAVELQYGRNYGVPAVTTAWGARAILGDQGLDILPDRVDAEGPRKKELLDYLKGLPDHDLFTRVDEMSFDPGDDELHTVVEDDNVIVVASTNASHGYLYLRAWFKADEIG